MSDKALIVKETTGYVFNHTMLRIKDPKKTLDFYQNVLGMSLVRHLDFSEWKFSLYFLVKFKTEEERIAFENLSVDKKAEQTFSREGVLELTHNHGTELNETTPYHNGNTEPRGFGHICFSVPNIQEAQTRFEKMGVQFQKKLGEGGMKNIMFIKDPDNYWIEIVEAKLM